MPSLPRLTLLILLSLLGTGCATIEGPKNPNDPLESYNRAMYTFNDTFDRDLFRPVAEGYNKVMPQQVNTSISNFFSNLDDIVVLLNDLLQFKLKQGVSDFSRLTWNTTAGLFGIFDVASHMDLPKHDEDFGQTLGYWGVGSGPYIVLPFLGPSTLRDGPALIADWQVDPVFRIEDRQERWTVLGIKFIDKRAGLLKATSIIETASLDPYAFMRDAYLQRRENLVYDGNPPIKDEFDPFSDEFDPLKEPAPDKGQPKSP